MEKLALSLKALGTLSGAFAVAEFYLMKDIWTALAIFSALCFAIGSNIWSILRVRKTKKHGSSSV